MEDSKPLPVNPLPTPTESVTLDLGDGVLHPIRYTIGTMRRLKMRLGLSMIGLQGMGMLNADEASIPEIIFEGLCDDAGNPPEGVTLDKIIGLPAAATPYLLKRFSEAYTQSTTGEKKMPWEPTDEERKRAKLAMERLRSITPAVN